MLKNFSFIFVLGFFLNQIGISSSCFASESIIQMQDETIIIQGEKVFEEKEINKIKKMTPTVGIGSEKIDNPKNSYGVEVGELLSKEEEDISLDRREEPWWSNEEYKYFKLQNEIGPVQFLKVQGKLKQSDFDVKLKGQYLRDYHHYYYKEPTTGIFDFDTYRESSFQKKKKQYYLSAQATDPSKSFLYERDGVEENALLQTQVRGWSKKHRNEMNASFERKGYKGTLYFHNYVSDFKSYFSDISSKEYKERKFSFKGDKEFEFFKLSLQFSDINGTQNQSIGNRYLEFNRQRGKLGLSYDCYTNWTDLQVAFDGDLSKDKDQNNQRKTLTAFNFAGEFSSSKQFFYGGQINFRYFNLIPSPKQLFGDGEFLNGNPDLPVQKGIRVSVGPWLDNGIFKSHLKYFFERSKDAPIMEAVSSFYAKTLPIGGVETNGIDLMSSVSWRDLTLEFHSIWQRPINTSESSWQNGNRVPGRPEKVINVNIDYLYLSKFQIGTSYNYESGKYRDKAGMDLMPSTAHIDGYVGYKNKKSNFKLLVNNLYMSKSLKNSYPFEGSVGDDILHPTILDRELKFVWEFIL